MSQQPSPAATPRRRWLTLVVPAALGLGLLRCHRRSELRCDDTSGLAPDVIAARKALDYRDRTEMPAATCERCSQFVPADSGCASCRIMGGPIHPDGWCKVFAPKS